MKAHGFVPIEGEHLFLKIYKHYQTCLDASFYHKGDGRETTRWVRILCGRFLCPVVFQSSTGSTDAVLNAVSIRTIEDKLNSNLQAL